MCIKPNLASPKNKYNNLTSHIMLRLFKKKPKETEAFNLNGRSTNEIIQEIHDTFYTEVDRLLAEAKISRSLDSEKTELIEKCKRLEALGFTKTKEVLEAKEEIRRIEAIREHNQKNAELVEAIEYFSFKYPHYKFITEESVIKICEKYNLIYGPISNYTGTVPDKNLKHIEEFKISPDDDAYAGRWGRIINGEAFRIKLELDKKMRNENLALWKAHIEIERLNAIMRANGAGDFTETLCPLEIAAPLKDFDTKGMEIKGHKLSKIEIPDPVVLKPVAYKNTKHYLIVTAWGQEASDELVINPVHN